MDATTMTVGRIYQLKGGSLFRFYGLYNNIGPCLAFGDPSRPIPDLPNGYSARPEDVLREITKEDTWLKDVVEQYRCRGLYHAADEICFILKELGGL